MRNPIFLIGATLVFLFFALVLGTGLAEENYRLVAIIFAVPLAVFLIAKPTIATFLVVVLWQSALTIPQLQGRLNLFHIAASILFIGAVLRYAFDKHKVLLWSSAHAWLIAFACVIINVMMFRGAGINQLGDENWGGMSYVEILLTMSLVFTIPRVSLSSRKWRLTLTLAFLAPLLPAIASTLMIYTGAFNNIILGYLQVATTVQSTIEGLSNDNEVLRLTTFQAVGMNLLYIVLLYWPIPILFSIRGGFGILISFFAMGLVGLTGYRTSFITIFLTFGTLLAWTRALTLTKWILAIILATTLYATILVAGSSLPPSFQRMVSFLPGVEVHEYVATDAAGTFDWRLQLWQRGIEIIPEYWLLGKGYTFSASAILAAYDKTTGDFDPLNWAIVNCSYHQGILSLLIGLGLPGLVTGMMMFYLFVRRHIKFQKEQWLSAKLQLCHLVMTAIFFISFLSYIFLYGDVQTSFPAAFYTIGILEGLWAANLADRNEEALHIRMNTPAMHILPTAPPKSKLTSQAF